MAKVGLTRAQLLGEEDAAKAVPPLTPDTEAVMGPLMACGPCTYTAHGMEPLSWSEIISWPGTEDLLPVEIVTTRNLSMTYVSAFASAADAEQPWGREE